MHSNSMSVNHKWKWFGPILYKKGWGYNSLFILSQDQHLNQISANHWQVFVYALFFFLFFFLRAQNGLVCTNPSPYLVLSEDISEICRLFEVSVACLLWFQTLLCCPSCICFTYMCLSDQSITHFGRASNTKTQHANANPFCSIFICVFLQLTLYCC